MSCRFTMSWTGSSLEESDASTKKYSKERSKKQRRPPVESLSRAEYLSSTFRGSFMLTWIVLVFASIGFLISLYFSLVHFRVMAPDVAVVPRVCRLSKETCQAILSTPDSRLLGIPNFLLGTLYYLTLILLGLLGLIRPDVRGYEILLMLSFFTVFLGAYLTHSLLVKLRVMCILCFASHAVNLILAVVLFALWIS